MIFALCSWLVTVAFLALHLRAHRRLVLVARACHELRGPLFAAQLGLHGLRGEPARLAAIELELERAGRALDDLAAAPAGGHAGLRREPVELAALVESYAPTWSALAARYGAVLRVEAPEPGASAARAGDVSPPGQAPPAVAAAAPRAVAATTVLADPLRIAQACANLVGNAAEHGGGEVRVRVRPAGESVRIEVSDDGAGLPAPVPVLTASALGRRGRRGHGLAIAAAIAADHGGRLAAAPSQAGARLMLELPAAA